MKNLIKKRMATEVPITSVLEIKNGISLFRNPEDDKAALLNLALYLTALLLTLPVITVLAVITARLIVWF